MDDKSSSLPFTIRREYPGIFGSITRPVNHKPHGGTMPNQAGVPLGTPQGQDDLWRRCHVGGREKPR